MHATPQRTPQTPRGTLRTTPRTTPLVLTISLLGLLLLRSTAAQAADYYFSPGGSDTAGAGTASSPWATLNKASALDLQPGDRVLLQGGQSFSGTLTLTAEDWGTTASPVRISSYGTGRATILAGSGTALNIYNVSGVAVSNLALVGAGLSAGNNANGLSVYTDLPGATKLDSIRLEHIEAQGFGQAGVSLGAWPADGSKSGFRNVSMTNVVAHDNADVGIQVYGYFSPSASGWAHENVYVGHCTTFNNKGILNKASHTGSGIVLGDVNAATIERCLSYNNGENNTSANGGPVGIWTWDANNVVIQYNESYGNKTRTLDGGGFDLDGGVTNSVLQYNYSHNNDGAGYLLAQFSNARPFGNNTVRYNISENDGRRGNYGAIHFWNGGSGIFNSSVHNNTIYVSAAAGANPVPIRFQTPTNNTYVRNNIFITTGGLRQVDAVSNQVDVQFQGNAYWSSGSTPSFVWSGTSYQGLASWRAATGQERLNGVNTGFDIDPRVYNAGGGGTIGNADALSTLNAYKLLGDSPLIDRGLTLQTPGARDFFGVALPQGQGYDVGASEYYVAPPSPTPTPIPTPSPTPAPTPTPVPTPAGPTFTSKATASRNPVQLGLTTSITATVINSTGTLSNGIVDLEIYNAAGTQVGQRVWTAQNFSRGQKRSYSLKWKPSERGMYTVKVSVLNGSKALMYHRNNNALAITVR